MLLKHTACKEYMALWHHPGDTVSALFHTQAAPNISFHTGAGSRVWSNRVYTGLNSLSDPVTLLGYNPLLYVSKLLKDMNDALFKSLIYVTILKG